MRLANVVPNRRVASYLAANHYLGPAGHQGWAWQDEFGVMVLANPRSRALPHRTWLELVRWCLRGDPNDGSQQWARFVAWAKTSLPHITTFVSYSDPSAGHTGALYRACNWLWAPTWQRLRPPPSGNGDWGSGRQSVKDRWVFPVRPDLGRASVLAVQDAGLRRRYPWAEYTEPSWSRGHRRGGGGDFKAFRELAFPLALEPHP
jgi:hypothetical protein